MRIFLTLIFLCSSGFGQEILELSKTQAISTSEGFSSDINLSGYLFYVKSTSILLNEENDYSASDIVRFLIKNHNSMTVTIMSDFYISEVLNDKTNNSKMEITRKLLKEKQLFIVLYKSLDRIKNLPKPSIFDNDGRSYFIIFITGELPEERAIKECFEIIWKKYKILEVTLVIIQASVMYRFNPIKLEISPLNLTENPFSALHGLKQFDGYPLKVKKFNRVPTLVYNVSESLLTSFLGKDIANVGDIGGIDGFLLGNMVKALNMSPDITEPEDGIEYGWMYSNGTFTGTIGQVISRSADISINGRFLKYYGTDEIEFTFPAYHDKFCILVPKASKVPTWMNIFLGFTVTVWYLTMITVVICGIFWWFIKSWSPNTGKILDGTLNFCFRFMEVCLLIAGQSTPLPYLDKERIFIAGCLVFNVIFSGIFQGYLTTAFSTTSFYPDINTLENLDSVGLPIATSSKIDDMFGDDPSGLLKRLKNKVLKITTAAIDRAAEKRDVSAVERRSDAYLLIELHYVDKTGAPLLHVVNECPRSYYLSYIVYRGYPFLPHLNDYIRKIVEGGFNDFWYRSTVHSIILNHRTQEKFTTAEFEKISLVDVQTAFYALGLGLIMAFIVLIGEIIYIKRKFPKRIGEFNDINIPPSPAHPFRM